MQTTRRNPSRRPPRGSGAEPESGAHPLSSIDPMPKFEVLSEFKPAGDQPKAIVALSEGVKRGDRFQTLLGITGSGKSATVAWTIGRRSGPPCSWRRTSRSRPSSPPRCASSSRTTGSSTSSPTTTTTSPRPTSRRRDTYIEKDSSINDEIDRLRHSTTASLLTRRDVIIVASVSCDLRPRLSRWSTATGCWWPGQGEPTTSARSSPGSWRSTTSATT